MNNSLYNMQLYIYNLFVHAQLYGYIDIIEYKPFFKYEFYEYYKKNMTFRRDEP